MNIFDVSLDSDIDFLIKEIGYDIKINNVSAKALINNKDNANYDFDDKEIIVKDELQRGQYVNYNNKNWIVISEINDKRYNSYHKGLMRRCNESIKIIADGKLYLFYSITDGDKFLIEKEQVFSYSNDAITVTLPSTPITSKIAKQDAFIKWGQKWEVQGIDYTKSGLIILHCKVALPDSNDDIENEIANKHKLDNPDAEPILPFMEDEEEPEIPDEPEEPEEPENITYTYSAIMPYPSDPDNEIWWNEQATYTIHKFVDEEEVDGQFTFVIGENKDCVEIVETTDNSITIKAIFGKRGNITIVATDVETSTIAIEKGITITGG